MFYTNYISDTSNAGYIDEYERVYLKSNGTVTGKEIRGDSYDLRFTYPDGSSTYRGVKQVSKGEYEKSQPGDKFIIYYNPADPEKWLLPRDSKLRSGAIALAVMFALCFLPGMAVMVRTLRKYFRNR